MSLWQMILTAINLVGVRLGGAAIGLASQILLARLLPQQDVGIVLMTMSAAAILSLLITAGYPSLALTVLPRYYALGRGALAMSFRCLLWRDVFVATAAVLASVAAFTLCAPPDGAVRDAFVFGALMAPALGVIRIASAFATARRRFQLSYMPDFILRAVLLLAFLLAAWVLGARPSLHVVLGVLIAVSFVAAAVQFFLLGKADTLPQLGLSQHRGFAAGIRRRAAAMALIAVVAFSFADLVTLLGGLFLPPEEVAQLGIAVRLAALAGFVTQSMQTFVLPDLSAAMVAGDRTTARALIFRINQITVVSIGACVVGSALLGPHILSVFGPGYDAARWVLVILMGSQIFRAAGGMNQHLLSLAGRQAQSALACGVALLVLLISGFVLSRGSGVAGMAWAVLLAEASWAAVLGVLAQRHTRFRGDLLASILGRTAAHPRPAAE